MHVRSRRTVISLIPQLGRRSGTIPAPSDTDNARLHEGIFISSRPISKAMFKYSLISVCLINHGKTLSSLHIVASSQSCKIVNRVHAYNLESPSFRIAIFTCPSSSTEPLQATNCYPALCTKLTSSSVSDRQQFWRLLIGPIGRIRETELGKWPRRCPCTSKETCRVARLILEYLSSTFTHRLVAIVTPSCRRSRVFFSRCDVNERRAGLVLALNRVCLGRSLRVDG